MGPEDWLGAERNDSKRGVRLAVLVVLLFVLAYLGGVSSAAYETFPYPQLLERPFQAIQARKARGRQLQNVYQSDIWMKAVYERTGAVDYDSERAWKGYTFFSRSHRSGAVLIDMEGRVLHDWFVPFRKIWEEPTHTNHPPPESHIYWRRVKMFPNGDVMAIVSTVADTPYGYGIVRVDKESNVLWAYDGHAHHDFDVREDGSVYTLVQRFRHTRRNPLGGFPQFPNLVLEDYLVKLSPEGEEIERVNLLEAIAESDYRAVLEMYAPGTANPAMSERDGDVLHANAVAVVDEAFARHHGFAEPGQVLVSFRPLDAIALVDVEEQRIAWMTRGFWTAQHDPDPMANGHILLFDNRGSGGTGGASRILEYAPSTHDVRWRYRGARERPFQSRVCGAQELLPNGNVLVTSSQEGRLFEVTREGEIVWDYRTTVRRTYDGDAYHPALLEASRVEPESLSFTPDGVGAAGND